MDETFRKYGCKLVGQAPSDIKYRLGAPVALPPAFILSEGFPPIYNQGTTGSCTGNAWAAAFAFQAKKQNIDDFDPSRLFIYYNERILESSTGTDAGAQVKSGGAALSKYGAAPDNLWPFIPAQIEVQPPDAAYTEALTNLVTAYKFVDQDLISLKTAIYNSHPIVFGFTVFESFESSEVAATGVVQYPGWGDAIVGGHCVVAIGWSDVDQAIWCRNSWGAGWGKAGLFQIPYRYITNPQLATDFWIILTEN